MSFRNISNKSVEPFPTLPFLPLQRKNKQKELLRFLISRWILSCLILRIQLVLLIPVYPINHQILHTKEAKNVHLVSNGYGNKSTKPDNTFFLHSLNVFMILCETLSFCFAQSAPSSMCLFTFNYLFIYLFIHFTLQF